MRDSKSDALTLSRAPAQIEQSSHDLEDQTMNKYILEGKWRQMRGRAKAWWGKLIDDEWDRAAGKFDILVGMLQQTYGYNRQRAAYEIDKRMAEFEANVKKKTRPTPTR
jgi:uncharacterized protein YjbJ (UPF0337 family)